MTTHVQPWLRKAGIVLLFLFNLPLIVLVAFGTEALSLQIGWWTAAVIFFVLLPAGAVVSVKYPWWELFLLTHTGTALTSVLYTLILSQNTDGNVAVYALVTWHTLFALNYFLEFWRSRY